jgi:hypothetical protein
VIVSESRERFMLAIAERLPGVEIIEAHFFSPRRQGGMESGVAVVAARVPVEGAEPHPFRYTVFSARYTHTLKGAERGKWEAVVTAEADAPLVTVDEVVRGVQRRAEETDDVARLTGGEFRAVIERRLLASP